ncbi:MAG: acetylxylan esterase [Thermomicrobiales bacterium]
MTSVRKPDDFDEFWADLMAQAAALPLDPVLTPAPMRSNDQVETFEIHYTSLDGLRIAGWYCRPRESALEPPYPALIAVPGYISEPTLPKQWAKAGYAAVGVAPRGKLRSNSRFNPGYPGLLIDNIIDKNTYSYRGFYIDAARVDFVLSRPEIDHSRIGVQGGSQEALTLTTAALRSDVITCGAAGAPYLTGYMDAASLTHSYPYPGDERVSPVVSRTRAADARYARLLRLSQFRAEDHLPHADLDWTGRRCLSAGDSVRSAEGVLGGPVEYNAWPRCAADSGAFWEGRISPRSSRSICSQLRRQRDDHA